MLAEKLYVVGQRRDGSYETFELRVPGDEASTHALLESPLYVDVVAAVEACEDRRLAYINCSRPRPREGKTS